MFIRSRYLISFLFLYPPVNPVLPRATTYPCLYNRCVNVTIYTRRRLISLEFRTIMIYFRYTCNNLPAVGKTSNFLPNITLKSHRCGIYTKLLHTEEWRTINCVSGVAIIRNPVCGGNRRQISYI